MDQVSKTQNLAKDLVNILYSNTDLNYDSCAINITKVLQCLKENLEIPIGSLDLLIESVKDSLLDLNSNPDCEKLNQLFQYFDEINKKLQTGETNFYECNLKIEHYLKFMKKILSNQSIESAFTTYIGSNRHYFVYLCEIWNLSTDNKIKNLIIELLNISFRSDYLLVDYLFRNSNLAYNLCFSLKENIKLKACDEIILSLNCLCYLLNNITTSLPEQFIENIKTSRICDDILDLIELDVDIIYLNVKELFYKSHEYVPDDLNFERKDDENENILLIDLLIFFILSLNLKFDLPEKNILMESLLDSSDTKSIRNCKPLSEKIIFYFNLEKDPVERFKLAKANKNIEENYFVNSILKFMSDLFSLSKTQNSTSIFYYNDFKILIDIIVRKLNNLSSNDQIRSDYLSLIQLIIKNSIYTQDLYRVDDLLICFNSILSEKDNYTIDQDIVRIILKETPQLLNN